MKIPMYTEIKQAMLDVDASRPQSCFDLHKLKRPVSVKRTYG